jgi:hypothetical protein
MSLQEYVRAELGRGASLRTPAELGAEVERRMEAEGQEGFAGVSAADLVRGDREGH